jgi:hypothetical protein
MSEAGFWPSVFRDLPRDGEQPYLDADHLTDTYLAGLRKRIKAQELPTPPAGEFTTDPNVALNTCNRMEIQQAFCGYLRRVAGLSVRAYVPVLPQDYTGAEAFRRAAFPWTATADDPEAAQRHAQYRLTASVATAIQLHGAALVKHTGLTPQQVGAIAHGAVERAVERLAAELPPAAKGERAA